MQFLRTFELLESPLKYFGPTGLWLLTKNLASRPQTALSMNTQAGSASQKKPGNLSVRLNKIKQQRNYSRRFPFKRSRSER